MTTIQVNYINMGLMVISMIAAIILPFEVFLFSYAVLGPLHYLTQISWMHDRQYFSEKKYDYILLAILAVLILFGSGIFELIHIPTLGKYGTDLSFAAFGIALIFILTKDLWKRVFASIVLLAMVLGFHNLNSEPLKQGDYHYHYLIFSVYLPTLIHVYIFTGLFILYGALKRSSMTGYISIGVFIACAIACLVIPYGGAYEASEYAVNSYGAFRGLNQFMLANFDSQLIPLTEVFTNDTSIIFTRFIGFAYTYHYLNWFSKTSIIKWHKVPKVRFIIVIAVWIASVGLYATNYRLGFNWLFLLSFMHVFLEFPLNHRSFIGIGQEIGKRINGSGQEQVAGEK